MRMNKMLHRAGIIALDIYQRLALGDAQDLRISTELGIVDAVTRCIADHETPVCK